MLHFSNRMWGLCLSCFPISTDRKFHQRAHYSYLVKPLLHMYCIVLYLVIYKAHLSATAFQKHSQCEQPCMDGLLKFAKILKGSTKCPVIPMYISRMYENVQPSPNIEVQSMKSPALPIQIEIGTMPELILLILA